VTLLGRNFFDQVHTRLDDESHGRLVREWRAWIGEVAVPCVRLDDRHLLADLPPLLAPGHLSVAVTSPWGEHAALPEALRVHAGMTDAGMADAGALELPPFTTPVRLAISDPQALDGAPAITADLRELYFDSNRGTGADIYVSLRASAADPWGTPELVSELSSTAYDGSTGIAGDGLTIWFSSARGGGTVRFYTATRPDRSAPWSQPTAVSELGTGGDLAGFTVASSALVAAFHSDSTGSVDLYRSSRAAPGAPWGAPAAIPGVNSGAYDGNPVLDGTSRVIAFDSDRPGGQGARDLYWVRYDAAAAVTVVPLDELNSSADDRDLALSPDLRYAIFASDRSGNLELYEARR
jgi:hypothetical protein